MKALTERQSSVLDFIISFSEDKGFPPTKREITEHLNVSSENSAYLHVRALEKKGFISVAHGVARGIKVNVDKAKEHLA